MTYQELLDHNKNREFKQVAFLTSDMERSVKRWVEVLGVGPWQIMTFSNRTMRNFRVGGELITEPFTFLVALCDVGSLNLELIQPVSGPTIYQKYIDQYGEGLHHLKERVEEDQLESRVGDFRDKGIGVLQTGWYSNDVHYYMDTEPLLDFIFEMGNCPAIDADPASVRYYPPITE